MNFIAGTFGRNLELEAADYAYDPDSFAPLYTRLAEKIAAYDPDFGPYLSGHLSRVARDVEQFMIRMGYEESTALKIGHAFALHDLGKIKQDPELWRLTADKRELTPAQKKERPRHIDLGIDVLDETIAELGMELTADQTKHLEVVKYLMHNHHERLDGSGPKALPGMMMDPILRICAIVDTVDGKTKAKTLTEIFVDMSGSKHAGQFDARLVTQYQPYYTESRAHGELAPQPVLANRSLSR
jgi:HD-GYP domain-containing protein (c-di-GMP phosphodiesterase class II)